MDRAIVGYHQDREGHWVAELDCGHNQHLYHRPPFQVRPWVLDAAGRADRQRSPLDCPLCDRAELPADLRRSRRAEWDRASLPAGLLRAHRLGARTWGRLVVHEGRLVFRARTAPPIDRVLEVGDEQAIPPGVEHEIEPDDRVRVSLEFLFVVPFAERGHGAEGGAEADTSDDAAGGESACFAHLLCPDCGGVVGDRHLEGCPLAEASPMAPESEDDRP